MRALFAAGALVTTAAACGDNSTGTTDAADAAIGDEIDAMIDAPRGPCWPATVPEQNGTIQLGTGDVFEPMPDQVYLVWGSQGGFHIPVHARVTSALVAGDVADSSNQSNPKTRFSAFYVDTGEPLYNGMYCPTRVGYVPSGGSGYDLSSPLAVLFPVGTPVSEIFNREVRVVVEIIDAANMYAKDEKVVTCLEPPVWGDT